MFHFFGGSSFNPNTQIFGWTVVRPGHVAQSRWRAKVWLGANFFRDIGAMLCLSYVESI